MAGKKKSLVSSDNTPQNRFLKWWESVEGGQQFKLLFDQLENVFFFAKDEDSRIVAISEPLAKKFAQRLGLKSTAELRGLTDYDIHKKENADQYVADDRLVLTTGKPLIGRIEMWTNQDNELAWSLTTKVPVRDAQGNVIGVIGTVRNYNSDDSQQQRTSLANTVVEYITLNHKKSISIHDVARQVGLSTRHLNRQFRQVFSISVQEFLIRQRLQSVKTALAHGNQPISQIAKESGFFDQSSMTKLFRKYIGMTPLKYRKAYRSPMPPPPRVGDPGRGNIGGLQIDP